MNVGDPVLLGVKPEPDLDAQGFNKNPIDRYFSKEVSRNISAFSYKILDRFNYFIRECLFSGLLSNGTQVDRVLVKDNCKTDKYHVQLLSKYGRRDGHFMMFESMGIQERLKAKCFSLSIEF